MSILRTLRSSENDPIGYMDRPTVKAVVTDGTGRILLFSGSLLGGGVEPGEDLETALKRECLEEAGISIEIVDALGEVVQFRDALKRRYLIHGFFARYQETLSDPTTTSPSEQKRRAEWHSLEEAKALLQQETAEAEQIDHSDPSNDRYQSSLFSSMTALLFIEEAERRGHILATNE